MASSDQNGQDTTPSDRGGVFNRAKVKICDKCDETFPSISKFNVHRATCKKHKCPNCVLRFVTGKELKEHIGTHRILFHCDECVTKPFHSQGALTDHKMIVHDGVIKCSHCDQTFSSAYNHDNHVKTKHDVATAQKCACGATYVKKDQLTRHEENCVLSPIGGAIAVKRKYTELLESSKTPDSEGIVRDNVASIALKAFDMVRDAAQKKLKKADERLNCYVCGAKYENRKSLKKHIRDKHGMECKQSETVSE